MSEQTADREGDPTDMDGGESGHVSTRFWPTTFEERGVVAPFTTPMLSFARVRSDGNEGLEILIPGMSGSTGIYVIAWGGVPELFRMSVHDRALHERIADAKASTPRGMRRCAQEIAMSGLAGTDAVEAARKAYELEENERLLVNYFLISATVDALSASGAKLTLTDITTGAGKKKVRGILSEIAGTLGVSAEQMYADLEVWSDLIAPVGLPHMPQETQLRDLLKRLERFRMIMSEWGRRTNADTDGLSTLTAEVARLTIDISYDILWTIDDFAKEVGPTLQKWRDKEGELRTLLDRISWILDGWEHVIAVWEEAADGPIWEQADALNEIVRMLPLVPKKEIEALKGKAWGQLENALRTHVKALQGWQSGETDLELALRIEKNRAAAL